MTFPRRTLRARRAIMLSVVGLVIGVAALYFFGKWALHDRHFVVTDNAFVAGNLAPVQADANGVVAEILAEDTQSVKKGDILMRLDGQRAAAALALAEADLGRAARSISGLYASRRQVCEKIASRGAARDRARHDLARYRQASGAGAVSQQQVQNATDQLAALEADLREARAERGVVEARVGALPASAHPDVAAAKAKYVEAAIDVARQTIRAPLAGVVAKRKAQVGQRVKPGDQLLTLVPLDHLWVEANVWETRLEHIHPGQPATVEADIYGSRVVYHGVVEGIAPGAGQAFALLPPDNATGNFIHIVQRVPVRIALRPDELVKDPLRPGLSTVATIDVSNSGDGKAAAKAEGGEYRSDIWEKDLTEARAHAEEILRREAGVSGAGSEIDCSEK